jgi:MFS family permease
MDEAEGIPWNSTTLRVVLLSTALAPLGVPLISASVPFIGESFGVSDTLASLMISSYFITGIFLSPSIGWLIGRYGQRKVLVTSLVAFIVFGLSVTILNNYTLILVNRVLQGTAAAGLFITTVSIISNSFDGVQRSAVLGVNIAVLSFNAAVFPVIGGYLASFSWRTPFLAHIVGIPVVLYVAFSMKNQTGHENTNNTLYSMIFHEAMGNSSVLALFGVTFLTEFLVFGVVTTVVPFLLAEQYGFSATFIGLIIMMSQLSAVVTSALMGAIAKRLSDNRIITLSILFWGIGTVWLYLADSAIMFVVASTVFGLGVGLCMPSVDSALSGLFTQDMRAGALSIRNSVTFLGRAAGPVVYTFVSASLGYRRVLLITGVLVLLYGVFSYLRSD